MPLYVQVATWLDAVLYTTNFRPVPLKQHIKDGKHILDHNNQVCVPHRSQYAAAAVWRQQCGGSSVAAIVWQQHCSSSNRSSNSNRVLLITYLQAVLHSNRPVVLPAAHVPFS